MTDMVNAKERDLSLVLEQNSTLNEKINELTAELSKSRRESEGNRVQYKFIALWLLNVYLYYSYIT